MSQLIRDVHVSGLRYVGESVDAALVESAEVKSSAGKYRRFSIPQNVNRHCLGYLEGPAASLSEDTRNGRGYTLQLWRNVENSADFQEGMQCATIIGENDHPEERIDYSLTKGSIVLTDWEIREDEDIVWARFAILDNDEGRTLLSYVKFGTIIGVSSRGLGDEIIQNGRTIIDPDTYEFYCFDAVAFPAAAVARTKFVEKDAVTESTSVKAAFSQRVMTEASKATTCEELVNLKTVVESTNVPDKESLVESISYKLSSLSESADDQSNTGDEDGEAVSEKQRLLSNLAEKETALDAKDNELAAIKELLKRRGDNASYFRRVVQEQQSEIETLNGAVEDCLESVSEVSEQLDAAKSDVDKLSSELKKSETELAECRKAYEAFKRKSECKMNSLKKENTNVRADLKNARMESKQYAYKAESLRSDLETTSKQTIALERKLASETALNAKALKESRAASKDDAAIIESLQRKVESLELELAECKNEISNSKAKLRESASRTQNSNKQTAALLTGYLRKCCEASGIDFEVAKKQIGNICSMNQIDTVVSEMANRQARFNMLPVELSPIRGRIVEHRSSEKKQEENAFVVRALNNGQ